jgi:hypothetical protein
MLTTMRRITGVAVARAVSAASEGRAKIRAIVIAAIVGSQLVRFVVISSSVSVDENRNRRANS